MTINTYISLSNFAPVYQVLDDNKKEIIKFNSELYQDIKYGDWAGMSGVKQTPLSNEQTWKELDSLYKDNLEAWLFLKDYIIQKIPAWK